MTSDAKVGLLLGLVFIVIIAFLINGLPNLLAKDGNGNMTRTTIPTANASVSRLLDDQADRAVQALQDMGIEETVGPRQIDIARQTNDDPRFSDAPPVAGNTNSRPTAQNPTQPNRLPRTKVKKYVVKSGDSLGAIAKKVYGPEQGNRLVIIQRLFEANQPALKSIDDVYVGQKLNVPSLSSLTAPVNTSAATAMDRVEQTGMFDRVRSVLRNTVNKPEPKVYVVKSDDSLWQIANKYLGDGNRYGEIVGLNNIPDGETIVEGMRLRLPKK